MAADQDVPSYKKEPIIFPTGPLYPPAIIVASIVPQPPKFPLKVGIFPPEDHDPALADAIFQVLLEVLYQSLPSLSCVGVGSDAKVCTGYPCIPV